MSHLIMLNLKENDGPIFFKRARKEAIFHVWGVAHCQDQSSLIVGQHPKPKLFQNWHSSSL
jgi:predicted Zn-dependent protease